MNAYLQPFEQVVETARAKIDVRSYTTNAEIPVPWANLARPSHDGSLTLTLDRLLVIFDPGNERALSIPAGNILVAWERAAKGKKGYPPQFVFLLPAGLHVVCELDSADETALSRLRRIVHLVTRTSARADVSDAPRSSAHTSDAAFDALTLAI